MMCVRDKNSTKDMEDVTDATSTNIKDANITLRKNVTRNHKITANISNGYLCFNANKAGLPIDANNKKRMVTS